MRIWNKQIKQLLRGRLTGTRNERKRFSLSQKPKIWNLKFLNYPTRPCSNQRLFSSLSFFLSFVLFYFIFLCEKSKIDLKYKHSTSTRSRGKGKG
ncbi:hypothetical protein BDV40DRAFT_28452 [Aspergillus tamarii]|uniref:Uncharacterized protein n=1 Tax=Aspergillus tamarii TaxID=41984 RepID=A0A5N6UI23_ASPTM|nr:hypothetical protein BDV40DRAFT_28452 [Aspergillus tamarii]